MTTAGNQQPEHRRDLDELRRGFEAVAERDALATRLRRRRRSAVFVTAAAVVLGGLFLTGPLTGGVEQGAAARIRLAGFRTLQPALRFHTSLILRRPGQPTLRDEQQGTVDFHAGAASWRTTSGVDVVVLRGRVYRRPRAEGWRLVARGVGARDLPGLLSVAALRALQKAEDVSAEPPDSDARTTKYRGTTSLTALLRASELPPIGKQAGETRVSLWAVVARSQRVVRQALRASRGRREIEMRSTFETAPAPLQISPPMVFADASVPVNPALIVDPLLRDLLRTFAT